LGVQEERENTRCGGTEVDGGPSKPPYTRLVAKCFAQVN